MAKKVPSASGSFEKMSAPAPLPNKSSPPPKDALKRCAPSDAVSAPLVTQRMARAQLLRREPGGVRHAGAGTGRAEGRSGDRHGAERRDAAAPARGAMRTACCAR
jgi:hypothetical protein